MSPLSNHPRPHSPSSEPSANPQIQSSFITKLPVELRLQIYEQVLGQRSASDILHIEAYDNVLKHSTCWDQEHFSTLRCYGYCRNVDWSDVYLKPERASDHPSSYDPRRGPRTVRSFLPLLLSCRLISAEATPVLYSRNAFDFTSPAALALFAHFLPHTRLSSIRTITLATGEALFSPQVLDQWRQLRRSEVHHAAAGVDDEDEVDSSSVSTFSSSSSSSSPSDADADADAEDADPWDAAARALNAMPNLRRLRVELLTEPGDEARAADAPDHHGGRSLTGVMETLRGVALRRGRSSKSSEEGEEEGEGDGFVVALQQAVADGAWKARWADTPFRLVDGVMVEEAVKFFPACARECPGDGFWCGDCARCWKAEAEAYWV